MKTSNLSFEDKLKAIEEIVEILDSGELNLEQMLVKFELGVKLAEDCRNFLEKAEQKVIDITKDKL